LLLHTTMANRRDELQDNNDEDEIEKDHPNLDKSLDEMKDDLNNEDDGEFRSRRSRPEKKFVSRDRPYYNKFQRRGNHGSRCYVGNLSYETTWQALKDHMRVAGNVTYADIIADNSGNSRGCGIVEYETSEEAASAIKKLNDTKLDGRLIFVREDREEGNSKGGNNSRRSNNKPNSDNYNNSNNNNYGNKDLAGRKLFIGNLPFTTTWQDLKDEFRVCGDIVRADILSGYDGRSKGQGTIVFGSKEGAQKAIDRYNNTDFQGRLITVREDRFAN